MKNIPLCMYTVFFYLFIHQWTLRLFYIVAIINNAAVYMREGKIYLFELVFLCSSDKYPEVECLDVMVVMFLIFWRAFILFSPVAAPISIPTNMEFQWFGSKNKRSNFKWKSLQFALTIVSVYQEVIGYSVYDLLLGER